MQQRIRGSRCTESHVRASIFRASSPVRRIGGLLRVEPPDAPRSVPSAPPLDAVRLTVALAMLFAAATARSRFPPLGRFARTGAAGALLVLLEGAMLAAAVAAIRSRSILLRNGLGRLSSSVKSYTGGAAGVDADRLVCGRPALKVAVVSGTVGVGARATDDDEEAEEEEEVDAADCLDSESLGCDVDARTMEVLRTRAPGARFFSS